MPVQRSSYFGTWAAKQRLKFWRDVGRVRIQQQLAVAGNVEWICRIWGYGQRHFGRFVGRWNCADGLGIAVIVGKQRQRWMRDWVQMIQALPRVYSE